MDKTPIWKPLLIICVVLAMAMSLYFPGAYTPRNRLKPGIDLAGGTTLVYQVQVPEDQGGNAKQIVDDVIAVLRDRVDPQGIRNLIWRQQAGNRIEIQMAVAATETRQRRETYLTLQKTLLEGNLSQLKVTSALRLAPDQRAAMFVQLADENDALHQALMGLADAHDRLTAITEALSATEQVKRDAQAALDAAKSDDRASKQTAFDQALDQAIAMAEQYNDALRDYQRAERGLFDTNVRPDELESVLLLYDPDQTKTIARQKYDQTLSALQADHPAVAHQIQAVAGAYEAYAQMKGPLDDPNDLIAMLKGSGVVEFRIGLSPDAVGDLADYRQQLEKRGPRYGTDRPYRWFEIDDLAQFADEPRELAALQADPEGYFAKRGMIAQRYSDKVYLLVGNTPELSITQAQSGWKLSGVWRSQDSNGLPAVNFSLNPRGGTLMTAMSGQHVNEPMAILLDGKVKSAPNIRTALSTDIQITNPNGFNPRELDYMVRTLQAGSVQASLGEQPISIKTTGPQLGQDNLAHGMKAAVWAFVAVGGFMLIYYLFAGLVADLALVANIVIILGIMAAFQGTFTLPGIAGIVLTIGMAVDANVLIFERIREELENRADLRTSVRLGFEKAFSTIIDANLTTMITCVVLYYTATADVKGFALTLMIGIVATLFTALFCSHVIIDLYVKLTPAKTLTMLPMICSPVRRLLSPNVKWVAKRHVFYTLSAVLILAGIPEIYSRGSDMLDIEFRSGTKVTLELKEGQTLTLAEARQRVTAALPDTTSSVVSVGAAENGAYRGFAVQTLLTDSRQVSRAAKEAFEGLLNVEPLVSFAQMGSADDEAPPVGQAPVYRVDGRSLGETIRRPDVVYDVGDYLGGVAIVLADMDPPISPRQLTERIGRMRQSPEYERLGYRKFEVVGLDLAPGSTTEYRSVVVLSRDPAIDYSRSPERFTEAGGLADTEWHLIRDAMLRDTSLASVSNFDSQVSGTMQRQAISAIGLALLAVVAYIWVRFGNLRYGLAAIVALAHDVAITLGLIGLSGYLAQTRFGQALGIETFRVDLALVAAVLTIIGYSLNDTIVVFDRIRENRGKLAFATVPIIDNSINQTISRTALTALTTLFAILTLYMFGGEGVHGFSFAMLIGVVVGTYSSIAIASPLLLIGNHVWLRIGTLILLALAAWGTYGGIERLGFIGGRGPADVQTVLGWIYVGVCVLIAALGLWLWSLGGQMKRQEA